MAQLPTSRGDRSRDLATRSQGHPLDLFRQQFDQLFDRMWGGLMSPVDRDLGELRIWDLDVLEDDKGIMVRAEVPGFEENEIDVQLNNGVLTIKAEKEQKGEGQQEYRSYRRTITLPSGIDTENAQATYRNGVLELRFPRSEEAKSKRIQIQGQQEGQTSPGGTAPSKAGERGQQTKANQASGQRAKT